MTYIETEGIYRGEAISWSIREGATSSKSRGIEVRFAVTEGLNTETGEWHPSPEPYETRGTFWVIGKDGQINQRAADMVMDVLLWDGSFAGIAAVPAIKVPCQFTVKAETWEGKTYHKVSWLNPYDFRPSAGASEDEVASLDATYGPQMRALAAARKARMGDSVQPGGEAQSNPPGTLTPEEEKATFDDVPF